jgi:DNA-binding CsgD family transcriptional regulator
MDFGLSEAATPGAFHAARERQDDERKLAKIYGLTGSELEFVSLLIQHRSPQQIGRLMGLEEHQVQWIRDSLMSRLGFHNVRDLIDIAKRTQLGFGLRPAEHLSRYVLPQLEGGHIISGILRDRDWCGLLVRLANGEQVTVWIDSSQAREEAGWVSIEGPATTNEQRSARWLYQVVSEKIEQLLALLDELDGDPDLEPEPLESDGSEELSQVRVSLGPALRTIQRKPGRKPTSKLKLLTAHPRPVRLPKTNPRAEEWRRENQRQQMLALARGLDDGAPGAQLASED